jgi:hypothetical protein
LFPTTIKGIPPSCIGEPLFTLLSSSNLLLAHAHGQWFSPGTLASFTTKTGRHDIAEILLKVALKHQKSNQIKSGSVVNRVRSRGLKTVVVDENIIKVVQCLMILASFVC